MEPGNWLSLGWWLSEHQPLPIWYVLDKIVQLWDSGAVNERPEYPLEININGRDLSRVIIDQHYRLKHDKSMSDEIILDLIRTLNGRKFPPEKIQGDHEYFTVEPVFRLKKPYRVVLVLCLTDDYVGVVNAFRVDKKGEVYG